MAKKLGCASCGGTMKKMAKGGTTKNVNISKPGAGYAKRTVGGDNQKMNMYGIAQTGQGQMDGKTGVMKKGGMVKKPLVKAQKGTTVKPKTPFQQYMKTPGAVASDTVAKRDDINTLKKAPNKPGLDAAYRKTYGDDYVGRQSDGIYTMSKKDADAQDRRMGPSRKMGGTTKKPLMKAQKGTTVKTKPIPNDVYKRDSTNYSKAADLYLNANTMKEHNVGRDSLNAIKSRYGTPNALEKRMKRTVGGYDLKKKGGVVKSKKK
jgi:hypothetical protein